MEYDEFGNPINSEAQDDSASGGNTGGAGGGQKTGVSTAGNRQTLSITPDQTQGTTDLKVDGSNQNTSGTAHDMDFFAEEDPGDRHNPLGLVDLFADDDTQNGSGNNETNAGGTEIGEGYDPTADVEQAQKEAEKELNRFVKEQLDANPFLALVEWDITTTVVFQPIEGYSDESAENYEELVAQEWEEYSSMAGVPTDYRDEVMIRNQELAEQERLAEEEAKAQAEALQAQTQVWGTSEHNPNDNIVELLEFGQAGFYNGEYTTYDEGRQKVFNDYQEAHGLDVDPFEDKRMLNLGEAYDNAFEFMEEDEVNSRNDMLTRVQEYLDYSWTAEDDLDGWYNYNNGSSGIDYEAGETYGGVPYSQRKRGVLEGLDFVINNNPNFYTTFDDGEKRMPTYGNDCSGFVGDVWMTQYTSVSTMISRANGDLTVPVFYEVDKLFDSTLDMEYLKARYPYLSEYYTENDVHTSKGVLSTNFDFVGGADKGQGSSELIQSYPSLTPGDAVATEMEEGKEHVRFVVGNDGEKITVAEQTPSGTIMSTYTYEELAAQEYYGITIFGDSNKNGGEE